MPELSYKRSRVPFFEVKSGEVPNIEVDETAPALVRRTQQEFDHPLSNIIVDITLFRVKLPVINSVQKPLVMSKVFCCLK